MIKSPPVVWDKHAIRAEVTRRGGTLTGIALAFGLNEGACRQALTRRHLAGEKAIAQFLSVKPETLWPERYSKPSPWAKRKLAALNSPNQKGDSGTDMGAAA